MTKAGNRKIKRTIMFALLAIFIAGMIAAWNIYIRVLAPNVHLKDRVTTYILIPTHGTFKSVIDSMQVNNILSSPESFEWTAARMKYDVAVKPGRYLIQDGWSNKDLITLLRSGRQSPVKVTFNNIRAINQLAGRISKLIEADSAAIVHVFSDDSLQKQFGLNSFNSISIVIPNTYEFYWNTSAKQFYERMQSENEKFWNSNRINKLKEAGFSKEEVVVLASIVEQETRQDQEKPIIAGVYINRYKQGWKLEADPTLVFASGDFNIRRVLNEHKSIDSPYNTYLYGGLPPGPICIPGVASIDAVLNYQLHDYFYFCAREDFSGYHAFAKTYNQHLINARKFHLALSRRGIMN